MCAGTPTTIYTIPPPNTSAHPSPQDPLSQNLQMPRKIWVFLKIFKKPAKKQKKQKKTKKKTKKHSEKQKNKKKVALDSSLPRAGQAAVEGYFFFVFLFFAVFFCFFFVFFCFFCFLAGFWKKIQKEKILRDIRKFSISAYGGAWVCWVRWVPVVLCRSRGRVFGWESGVWKSVIGLVVVWGLGGVWVRVCGMVWVGEGWVILGSSLVPRRRLLVHPLTFTHTTTPTHTPFFSAHVYTL